MDQKEVRRYLSVIKRAVSLIEGMLDNDDGGLLEAMVAATPVVTPKTAETLPGPSVEPPAHIPSVVQPEVTQPMSSEEWKAQQIARQKHISALLAIDCWPEAVPHFLVAKDASPEDQVNRANAVLDMMLDRSIEDAHFLDFGCGDGWIAQEATKRGVASSTGYDIKLNKNWSALTGTKCTHIYNELPRSHYDVIILYDVLDHCDDPIGLMAQVKSLLKKDGVVYVRCHPWTSRHATHLYKQGVNKAYLHLFLTPEEIRPLIDQEPNFTRVEKNPLSAYHWWFNQFDIKRERTVKESVNNFFHVPSFKDLLANEQQIPLEQIDDFLIRLQIQFVDYKLQLK